MARSSEEVANDILSAIFAEFDAICDEEEEAWEELMRRSTLDCE